MSYVKVSVAKPGENKGVGGDKKNRIIFFDFDDVATMPARDSKGIVITDNIVFNEDAYMISVYGTQDTIKANVDTEGDPDAEGIIQTVEFSHPGSENEIREFRSNWKSRNIGIIVERCSSNKKDLYGSPCAPLRLQFKAEDTKDKNGTTFTLKSAQKGPDVADYQGTLDLSEYLSSAAPDAQFLFDVAAGEGRHQITACSEADQEINGLKNCVDGGVYTLVGSGGSEPYTMPHDNVGGIILHNGTTWTALAGAEITLKAVKTGQSEYTFFEQSRK